MDISVRMPANHPHRPGPAVRIAAVPFPGQHLWHPSLPHDSFPSSHQWSPGTNASFTPSRHNVPRARKMERRPSPPSPRQAYSLGGPAGVRGRARIRGNTADSRRTSGSIAYRQGLVRNHYPAPMPLRTTAAGSSSAPRVTGSFHPQGYGRFYPRLPAAGCSTTPAVPALQRPQQVPGPHEEDAANRHKRPTCHGVNWQCETGLHHGGVRQPHRDRTGTPRAVKATRTTVKNTEPTSHANHPFRSPRPLSNQVQRVSTFLRRVVMW